jgi:hypothetical protein
MRTTWKPATQSELCIRSIWCTEARRGVGQFPCLASDAGRDTVGPERGQPLDRLRPVYPLSVLSMTIALRRQITCYTDLAMILALVDPCPRGVPRPSFTLPSGQTAQATQSLRAFHLKGTRCAACGLPGHHLLEFRTQRKDLSGLCLIGFGERGLTILDRRSHCAPQPGRCRSPREPAGSVCGVQRAQGQPLHGSDRDAIPVG